MADDLGSEIVRIIQICGIPLFDLNIERRAVRSHRPNHSLAERRGRIIQRGAVKQHAVTVVKVDSPDSLILKYESGSPRVDLEVVHVFQVEVETVAQWRNLVNARRNNYRTLACGIGCQYGLLKQLRVIG